MATIRCKSAFLMRSDTAKNWKDNNPVLRQGEEGYETDTGKRKIGNGSAAWKNLPYCDDALYKTIDNTAEELTSKITVSAQEERTLSNNLYSNALKGAVSGNAVKIETVSPIEHSLAVKINSKNLSPVASMDGKDNISGSISITDVTKNTDYTLSCDLTVFEDDPVENPCVSLRLVYTDGTQDAATYREVNKNGISQHIVLSKSCNPQKTLSHITPVLFDCTTTPSGERHIKAENIQLKYSNLTDVTVTKQGRNLLNNSLIKSPGIGLTLSANADGSYNLSGELTKKFEYFSTFPLNIPAGTTITATSWYNASDNNCWFGIVLYGSQKIIKQYNETPSGIAKTITLDEDCVRAGLVVRFSKHEIGDSITIKNINIQLEIGSTGACYEPYIQPTTYLPLADGTVNGIKSIYPTTTLLTDTGGIIIDCEYNRDINKAYEELLKRISTLETANTNI